jgi:hypothetical protein
MPRSIFAAPMPTQVQEVVPIVSGHRNEAIRKARSKCIECQQPSTTVSMTPTFFLHNSDPFINVMVYPVCANKVCHHAVRVPAQEVMAEGQDASMSGKWSICAVCGGSDGLRRCGKCNLVLYCGLDHQKQDWNAGHKRKCRILVKKYADLPKGPQ